jgi:type II secretory pathway pseudopilin PulG
MRAVNLIPADQRESASFLTGRSNGAALGIVVLVAGLALMAFLYGSAKHSESSSRSELAQLQAQLSAARTQAGRAAPYTNFISMANQRVQYFSQLVASRFDWSHAFNELGRVLPKDATLTSLHGQVGASASSPSSSSSSSSTTSAATPTSATPAGSTPSFSLGGCATSQSEVAQALQRLRLMDGVAAVELLSSSKGGSSSGAASPAGSCPSSAAVFNVDVTFAGLPTPPAAVVASNQSGAAR